MMNFNAFMNRFRSSNNDNPEYSFESKNTEMILKEDLEYSFESKITEVVSKSPVLSPRNVGFNTQL